MKPCGGRLLAVRLMPLANAGQGGDLPPVEGPEFRQGGQDQNGGEAAHTHDGAEGAKVTASATSKMRELGPWSWKPLGIVTEKATAEEMKTRTSTEDATAARIL